MPNRVFLEREGDGESFKEKKVLAAYAVQKILHRANSIFIASGTTSSLAGEMLATTKTIKSQLDLYTHSVPFAFHCMELAQAEKLSRRVHLYVLGGLSADAGKLDLDTGMIAHPDSSKIPVFDFLVWGTYSVTKDAIYAKLGGTQIGTMKTHAREIVLLPTFEKLGLPGGDRLIYLKNIPNSKSRVKPKWHLVISNQALERAKPKKKTEALSIIERFRDLGDDCQVHLAE